jgi:hypothetical protein
VPREVLFDLDPGMIGAVALRSLPLGELLSPNSLVNHMRRQNWTKCHYKELRTNSSDPHRGVAACVVNSEPHTGARPSVRWCMGPELARCVRNFISSPKNIALISKNQLHSTHSGNTGEPSPTRGPARQQGSQQGEGGGWGVPCRPLPPSAFCGTLCGVLCGALCGTPPLPRLNQAIPTAPPRPVPPARPVERSEPRSSS